MSHALLIERLSKRYRVPAPAPPAEGFAARGAAFVRKLARRAGEAEAFWALRDVSFSIAQGETVGIIGHNGAGKSTLLKILSRIVEPTSGTARVRGRMASLLEVGTGFHPDLSGRDNVYMNAAILGMRRRDAHRRFDEIVEFAGVERFIDTPVKHFSSGMKMRLAFAVAAHLEPEILVIDEVLAVGDIEFQKKCLNRIEQAAASGRTVLFVSHQMAAVARLCKRALLLDGGQVRFDGDAIKAIGLYEERGGGQQVRRVWEGDSGPGDALVRLHQLEVLADGESAQGPISVKCEIGIRMHYSVRAGGRPILPSVHLYDLSSTPVMSALDNSREWHNRPRPEGTYTTVVKIPRLLLNEGRFTIGVAVSTLSPFENHFYLHDGLQISVFDPQDGETAMGLHHGPLAGFFRPALDWVTTSGS
jgi:lipopolysaccharide transport system ATP-binding protein